MPISLANAVKEIEFIYSIGGVNENNVDYVRGIVDTFGEDAHEVLQGAAKDCRVLVATIAAEQDGAFSASAQLS